MKWIAAWAMALCLAGCATPNIKTNHVLDPKSGTGVATGSITYEGTYGAYRLILRPEGSDKTYTVEHGEYQTLNILWALNGEPTNPELGAVGSSFAVELPAGRYRLERWAISQGHYMLMSRQPVNIPFEIQPGKALYLGNFHFKATAYQFKAVSAATVVLNDRAGRDLPVLIKTFPSLAAAPITMTLAPQTRLDDLGGGGNLAVSRMPLFVPIPLKR